MYSICEQISVMFSLSRWRGYKPLGYNADLEGRRLPRVKKHSAFFSKYGMLKVLTVVNFFMFAGSMTLWTSRLESLRGRNSALKLSSAYCETIILGLTSLLLIDIAPILEEIHIPMYMTRINGTLFAPEHPSIARQTPNPEVEAAWEDLEFQRTFPVTKADVIKMGKDPATVARFDNEYWGFGEDTYMARIDIFHQLHCFNSLRTMALANYDQQPVSRMKLGRIHIGHCADILFQVCGTITCVFVLRDLVLNDRRTSCVTVTPNCIP
jgi:Mycotoxin biosynthesis protein UstYa